MKPINDTQLRIFGPLVLMFFGTFFFRLNIYLEIPPKEIAWFVLVSLSAGYLCWNLTRWVVMAIQRRHSGLPQLQKRLLIYLVAFPLLVHFAVFLRVEVHALRDGRGLVLPDVFDYASTTGIQIFYHCIYFGIYEGWYVLQQWRETHLEKEALLKIQWQTKFDSLKTQVNPHFLFNSLNTLSSLVDENPRLAGEFVDELSSVYRYLLRSNEQALTPLANELDFIRSYFHLLQTRYGKALEFRADVTGPSRDSLIPTLTLQLLVENAVKHNLILPEQPLRITIRLDKEGHLRVENTLQRKVNRVDANRIGLTNIGVRYRLLGFPEPLIEERNGLFSVALPLIPPNAVSREEAIRLTATN